MPRLAAHSGLPALSTIALGMALASPVSMGQPSDAPAHVQVAGEPTHYKGAVSLPTVSLDFAIRLVRGLDGAPSGSIDIPLQSVDDFPLSQVVWTGEAIRFTMEIPGQPERAWPRFEFTIAGDAPPKEGTLRQAGMEFPATLERLDGAPEPTRRPQTPAPPFPYLAREVTFESPLDADSSGGPGSLTIAGTLVLPEGPGPFPCAVFITGSGPQDRDETLFEHRPFWVLADDLARHGIASLRCDDRGVGGTDQGSEDDDSFDLATDVASMVEFVRLQPEIDPALVGLIGHSEGGLIGPIVAAEDPSIAFLVMLAGPGVPGDEILLRQGEAMATAMGVPQSDLDAQRPHRLAMFDAIDRGDTEGARAALTQLLSMSSPEFAGSPDGAKMLEQAVEGQLRMLESAWMRTFMAHDPRGPLRRVECPVLVLNGDLDMQVLHDQNVPEVEAALREGGNTRVVVHVLPGLNHMFQPATTGAITEYIQIETTFDPGAMTIIRDWIRDQTRERPGGG